MIDIKYLIIYTIKNIVIIGNKIILSNNSSNTKPKYIRISVDSINNVNIAKSSTYPLLDYLEKQICPSFIKELLIDYDV